MTNNSTPAAVLSAHHLSVAASAGRRRRGVLRAAAAGFSAVWLLGLAVPVPAVDLDASAPAVLAGVTGHEAAVALRSLLVHGLAAVALVAVAVALGRAVERRGAARLGRAVTVSGAVAATLSLAQFGLELLLAGPAAGAGDAGAANALTDAVNRLDGVKMLALAALALSGVVAQRRVRVLPGWLAAVGGLLAVALIVSAAGYALLLPGPATAAFVSLPLLLIWITGAGLALARRQAR